MPVFSVRDVTPGDTTSDVFGISDNGRTLAYVVGTVHVTDQATGASFDTGIGGGVTSLVVSPDGGKLAVTTVLSGASASTLYLVDIATNSVSALAQGVGQRDGPVTRFNFRFTEPSFSSDGNLLLFDSIQNDLVAGDANAGSDIFSYNLTTEQFTLLSGFPDGSQFSAQNAALSVDGTRLAFEIGSDLWLKNLSSGSVTRLIQGSGFTIYTYPKFSPDGAKLFYEQGANGSTSPIRGIFMLDIASGTSTSIDRFSIDGDVSSDGSKIVYQQGDSNSFIILENIMTSTTERINIPLRGEAVFPPANGYNPQFSGDGNFVFYSGRASDYIAGGGGTSVIMARLTPIPAGQVVIGTPGDDPSLVGGDGNDAIDGLAGADTMDGRGGADNYYVDNPGDVIIEAPSFDVDQIFTTTSYALATGTDIEALIALDRAATSPLDLTGNELSNNLLGNDGVNILRGDAGEDWLFGYVGDDSLFGGDGADVLIGGAGTDMLFGGVGDDRYILGDSLDNVIELTGEGFDTVYVSFSYALAADQEIEMLSTGGDAAGTAALVLTGNDHDNVVYANAGGNVLYGGGGADALFGLEGGDALFGGDGDDILYGGAGVDALIGDAGSDRLEGNEGNDVLDGGVGADVMLGGLGNDSFIVDNAGDVILEGAGQGTLDSVYALVSYTLAADAHVEQLVAGGGDPFAAIDLTGSDQANNLVGNQAANLLRGGGGNDFLFGNGGIDQLEGGLGNDTLLGGAGLDTLVGGAGNDVYIFENGSPDTIIEAAGEGNDVLYANFSFTLSDDLDIEVLSTGGDRNGTTAIDFTGNAIGNRLEGNAGVNALNGGGGDDLLQGLGGADTLTGGAGADRFFFNTAATEIDTITDFQVQVDKLLLARSVFGFNLSTGDLRPDLLAIGTAAADPDDRFVYDPGTGQLWFDPDGTGAAAAQQFALLQPALNLTGTDFLVY